MTLKYKCKILTAAIIADAIMVITGIATLLISPFSIFIIFILHRYYFNSICRTFPRTATTPDTPIPVFNSCIAMVTTMDNYFKSSISEAKKLKRNWFIMTIFAFIFHFTIKQGIVKYSSISVTTSLPRLLPRSIGNK